MGRAASYGLEVLSFGRAGTAPAHSCKLEVTGAHLLYDVTLDGGWVHFAVAAMDRGDAWLIA